MWFCRNDGCHTYLETDSVKFNDAYVYRHRPTDHGRNLVGDKRDIISHVPPLFSLRACIWRGFKTKCDVCHVLCEEFFILDVTHSYVDVEREFGVVSLILIYLQIFTSKIIFSILQVSRDHKRLLTASLRHLFSVVYCNKGHCLETAKFKTLQQHGDFLVMNRQPLELESCSNPLRIQQVFWSKSNKKFSLSVWGSLGGLPQVVVFLFFFSHLWPALGPNPLGHSFGSRFVWKLGHNPRL